jgi:hypothetical protein
MGIDTRIRSAIAAATITAALAAPVIAQARPNTDPVTGPAVVTIEPQAATSEGSGFQWGDAAIGAGVATLLLGGAVAAAPSARRRRTRTTAIG